MITELTFNIPSRRTKTTMGIKFACLGHSAKPGHASCAVSIINPVGPPISRMEIFREGAGPIISINNPEEKTQVEIPARSFQRLIVDLWAGDEGDNLLSSPMFEFTYQGHNIKLKPFPFPMLPIRVRALRVLPDGCLQARILVAGLPYCARKLTWSAISVPLGKYFTTTSLPLEAPKMHISQTAERITTDTDRVAVSVSVWGTTRDNKIDFLGERSESFTIE